MPVRTEPRHEGDQVVSADTQSWDREKVKFRTKCVAVMIEILHEHLDEYLNIAYGVTPEDVQYFAENILDSTLGADIDRLVETDPATRVAAPFARDYVFDAYKGISAIMYYRIANALIYDNILAQRPDPAYRDTLEDDFAEWERPHADDGYFLTVARRMSELAAVKTTIEINPAARIGKGLVIDHGVNVRLGVGADTVVVGETCEIGENCTILNGVLLGASEVNTGQTYNGRRHPKLGHNVIISGGARILGGISIGDNVQIGPNCVVTHDLPKDFRVTIINQLQYERPTTGSVSSHRTVVYGLVPSADASYTLFGEGLDGASLAITDELTERLSNVHIVIGSADDGSIRFTLTVDPGTQLPKHVALEIRLDDRRLFVMQTPALRNARLVTTEDRGDTE